jgi:tRNA (guanine26-N2/guanine27-N2)-dimethyltransferase
MVPETEFAAGFPTEIVNEGNVKVLVPKLSEYRKNPSDYAPSKAPVFYNPVMEFNRDVSVLLLQVYQRIVGRPLTVCEPLAGSGVRGIRYAAEVEGVQKVVLADLTARACKMAEHNVEINGLRRKVEVNEIDANVLLSQHGAPRKRFDVVDIDPFGSPVPYIDSAVRALHNGGLLALTATDMAALCGVHSKACIRKYGGKPLRTEYCHELAIRLLAACAARVAAKYDIGLHFVFSHKAEHYIRTYATIHYSAKKADESLLRLGYILHCFNCLHRESSKDLFRVGGKCTECGSPLSYAGPLWLGEIFDEKYVESSLHTLKDRRFREFSRMDRMLSLIQKEAGGPATYYVIDKVSDLLNLPVPAVGIVAETIHKRGFEAWPTHFHTRGLRSAIGAAELQNVVRELVQADR